ncbi:ADP-ribosylglycohydrolase family protein [Flagellimonas meridianipacifica]|uniref:ADP-ribosylglycohydrolase n=1 Tax=Flagellimonas meridianipacifica TaxID=1080225 RepID=A0A2T0MFT9_9FLAO|nr:ADP-ribosylglycohydrolase family protein [Allomuricauda pacifica]PRX56396.1 ADP-ribosylglycohydrolase [Allomuricauda pacifica]
MSIKSTFIISLVALILSCKEETPKLVLPSPVKPIYGKRQIDLSKEELHDRVLGALVGSAIGDAMGLSTEMWNRKDIQRRYGYITGLTPATSGQSAEGSWAHNLPEGATTDDTRWKVALARYIITGPTPPNANAFAQFIIDYYQDNAKTLADRTILAEPDSLDAKIEKINWIKEWARVALAFQEGGTSYEQARDRFYGGEISCAGMLYTPMFGLLALNAESAYQLAYEHTIFDMGYGRDISSIAAVMCNMALQTQDMDSILQAHAYIDPYAYQDSRLIGRIPRGIARGVENYILAALEIEEIPLVPSLVLNDSLIVGKIGDAPALVIHKDSVRIKVPENFPGNTLDWYRQEAIYQALERNKHMIAFHAGEIWEILYAGLFYGNGDFTKTMQFIVNYGRDNDTVAAIAGMILGAKDGFDKLPEPLRTQVLSTNKELLGIDLVALAQDLTNHIYESRP